MQSCTLHVVASCVSLEGGSQILRLRETQVTALKETAASAASAQREAERASAKLQLQLEDSRQEVEELRQQLTEVRRAPLPPPDLDACLSHTHIARTAPGPARHTSGAADGAAGVRVAASAVVNGHLG